MCACIGGREGEGDLATSWRDAQFQKSSLVSEVCWSGNVMEGICSVGINDSVKVVTQLM